MKKLNFSGIFIIVLLFLFSSVTMNVNAQEMNPYLSFENGIQEPTDILNTHPSRETVNGGGEFFQISFSFRGAAVANTSVNGVDYQYLHINGFAKMGQVGAPALPSHIEAIAVPPGKEGNIVILNSTFFEYDGYMIHPTLEPAWDTEGAPSPEFWIDESVYGKDEFFPKHIVEITNLMQMRGIPIAMTEIRPVQFNPVTGRIRVYTMIEFKFEYKGGNADFSTIADGNSLHFTNLLKRNVINSDNIPDGAPNSDSKAGEKNYIIITHDEYLPAANNLANWKRQLGYTVEVVSQSSWTAAQVKTSIENLYDAWTPKPDYFVIFGDHTGSYAVPGDVINTPYSPPDDGPFATDLYFSCMDGASDYHPDMAHGRISVSSLAEAQIAVNKIINYEKNPPTTQSFYDNILNCAQYQDDDDNNSYADRRFCHTSENIRDYLQDNMGYSSTRVYEKSGTNTLSQLRYNNGYYSNGQLLPADLRSTSFNWAGDEDDISAEINSGKFLVFHRDHGYTGGIGWAHPFYLGQNTYGYPDNIAGLSNGNLQPVLFSMNCHTGEYQLDNCFAEEFLRLENKGAVGIYGAAYFSLSGYNDALSIGMIDAIWPDPGFYGVYGSGGSGSSYTIGVGNEIYTLGDVLNQGLYAMEVNWGGSSTYDKYEYELFHLFGDPAMKIWTENPNPNAITATHSSTITCMGTSFAVSGSTAGATATLVFNDELMGEVVLDGSGAGSISYAITVPGSTVVLTISKSNCKPYEANLTITGACDFPPALDTDPATSVLQTTATLNGDITNDFGYTVSESGFVYSTATDPMIGGTGVSQVITSPTITTGSFSEGISGLDVNTTYYYKAYAITAGGTGYGNQEWFTTDCGVLSTLPYTQTFSSGIIPSCWQNIDNQGSGQVWEFNNPGSRTFTSTTGATGFAILDSDHYGNGASQDADMISPEFNFSSYASVNLEFQHYFREYTGSSAELLYSIDGGTVWNTIQSWSSSSANPATFSQDLSTEVAGESSVFFKWNYTGTWGYYWIVDDIDISGVEGGPSLNQITSLGSGWNIFSFCVTPSSCNMVDIVQPLIDNSSLVKVSDESGGFVQFITGIGWMNTIGDMENTEGYYIYLTSSGNLSSDGTPVSFPFDIPLTTGWNIMGYPADVSQNAMTVLQPLIDNNYLVKVINESGQLIQYISGIGWINTIVNFEQGEGYHVYVNTNCTLTLTEPTKDSEPQAFPEPPKPTEYFAGSSSNPFMPMNFVIRDIHTDGFGIEDGDEIAAFDGNTQVGSLMISEDGKAYHILTARTDDPYTAVLDGFEAGNEYSFMYFDKSENVIYTNIEIIRAYGDDKFNPLGTFMGDLNISSLGEDEHGLPTSNYLRQNFPNPFGDQTHIDYGIAENAQVIISVHDVSGRTLMLLENSDQAAGKYSINMNKASLEAGIYYYRIEVSGKDSKFSETRKMVIF